MIFNVITKRHLIISAGIIVCLITLYEGALYFFLERDSYYFQIDRCIDNGGCWDGVDKICRKAEPNAQELCDRAKVDDKTLEERIENQIDKINPEQ